MKTLRQIARDHELHNMEVCTIAALCDARPVVLGRAHGILPADEAKMLPMLTKLARLRKRQRRERVAITADAVRR